MGASWGGEPPIVVGAVATLEEAAVCLGFGAMCTVESLKKDWKSLKLYGFRKAQEFCSDVGLIGRDEQSNELTVERPGSFIGSSMTEIRGVYLELNLSKTRVQHTTHVKVISTSGNIQCNFRISSTTESRVSISIKSRVSTSTESRVSKSRLNINWESHLYSDWESHPNFTEFTSALDQCSDRIYKGRAHSHAKKHVPTSSISSTVHWQK